MAVVAVLLGSELVGFVAELRLNHVLEAKFIKRIQLIDLHSLLPAVYVLVLDLVGESEQQQLPDAVALLKSEVDVIGQWVLLLLVDVVPEIAVVYIFHMHNFPPSVGPLPLNGDALLGLVQKQLCKYGDVFWSSEDLIEREADDLVG